MDRSYGALLHVPGLARAIVAMAVGRIGEAMLPVVLVLTALTVYDSPPLAGLLTFLTVFPGLAAAPIIGALLDRYGRVRLIRLDYVVGAAVPAAIAVLLVEGRVPEGALLALTAALGVTQMFNDAGIRSLFTELVPDHLWEHVNAADSIGYQVAWIAGPPIAAVLFTIGGPAIAFGAVAVAFGLALVAIRGLRDPAAPRPEMSEPLAHSAMAGLQYVWRNPTLRGMATSVSVTNICFGIVTILVPILIVDVLRADEALVGAAFAIAGILGALAALALGRVDTLGRERLLIAAGCAGLAASAVLLIPVGRIEPRLGLVWLLGVMVLFGITGGAWDIGIFTLRQRRTDPNMVGRAFAISMALNQSGYPIGAAIGGWLAATSTDAAMLVGAAFGCVGTLLAVALIPTGRHPAESLGVMQPSEE